MLASVGLGGVLNAGAWISKEVVLTILGLGVLAFALSLASRTRQLRLGRSTIDRRGLTWAPVWVMAILQYLGSISIDQQPGPVFPRNFNSHDDFHGYFVFPMKMLATGSRGVDPFNERQLVSSLGGDSFLHTFVLAGVDERNLHILEPGMALIILLGLAIWHARAQLGANSVAAVLCAALVVLLPAPTVNISSLTTGAVGIVVVYFAARRAGERETNASFVLLGALVGATCALKSSLIPGTVAFVGLWLASEQLRGVGLVPVLERASLVGLAAAATLGPWMYVQYQSGGSALYPLLGRGYYGLGNALAAAPITDLTTRATLTKAAVELTDLPMLGLVMVGSALGLAVRSRQQTRWGTDVAAVGGAILGTIGIIVGLGGYAPYRLAYPLIGGALVCTLPNILRVARLQSARSSGLSMALLASCAAAIIVAAAWNDLRRLYGESAQSITGGLRGEGLDVAQDRARIRRAQYAVPRGDTLLARTDKPFLLDFRRNVVYVADWPGGVSPPPGMPLQGGADAVSRYLDQVGVRWVLYAYASEAGFAASEGHQRLANRDAEPWGARQALFTMQFQAILDTLRSRGDVVFDNGSEAVMKTGSVPQLR